MFRYVLPCLTVWSLACSSPPAGDAGTATGSELEKEEARRAASLRVVPDPKPWTRRVLYFVLLDRFANGDRARDRISGAAVCNDANDPHAYQGGDLQGLLERLDYIGELGADALWVSPLYRGVPNKEGANCGFPGYWADFEVPSRLELEPRYGDASAFDAVISAAHSKHMTVMLDMVVNHVGYGARLLSQRPGWFTDPSTCQAQGDPDIFCSLAGLPDFDHRNADVRRYLIDAHLAWVNRFALDGIRMDTVKHVPPDAFLEWNTAMRAARPGLFMLGELLDEHDFGRFDRYLGAGFDGLFNFPLRRGLIDTFARGGSVDAAAGRMQETLGRFGAPRTAQLVNLLDNHDVPRFLEEIPAGVSGEDATRRYLMALTALLTLPGIPQIYYGNELGMYGGRDPDNRRFMPTWAFEAGGRDVGAPGFLPRPSRVFDHVKHLIALRQKLPSLQAGAYRELWRQNGPANNNVWAYARHDASGAVLVAHNNGLLGTDGSVPLNVSGLFDDGDVLVDVLGNAGLAPVPVVKGVVRLSLPGQSAVLLVSSRAPSPLAPHAEVAFDVFANTRWGENVFVTGSTRALGNWDLNVARRLSASECQGSRCRWRVSLPLPVDESLEYKFVTIDEARRVTWEAGNNRVWRVVAGSSPPPSDFSSR
jgi:alpha-amylase